jgi:hypothetical protein
MMMPVNNLKEFVRCSRLGVTPERHLVQWVGECLNEVLEHRASSFEEAFGLQKGRGGVPWWLEVAMRERNEALRNLARHYLNDLTRNQQASEIAKLSLRYMASAWRIDRDRDEMPPRYRNEREEWLWCACKSGASMPLSERQLRNIL